MHILQGLSGHMRKMWYVGVIGTRGVDIGLLMSDFVYVFEFNNFFKVHNTVTGYFNCYAVKIWSMVAKILYM